MVITQPLAQATEEPVLPNWKSLNQLTPGQTPKTPAAMWKLYSPTE